MSKTLLLTAALGIALGAALLVRAYATELGTGVASMIAWYGPTNPAAEQGFMLVGILLVATGLAVVALPLMGGLSGDDATPPAAHLSSRVARRATV
jgi:hypothetical protein